jgi:hypothetical protein
MQIHVISPRCPQFVLHRKGAVSTKPPLAPTSPVTSCGNSIRPANERELLRSAFPIHYAEPDNRAERLILLTETGSGNKAGVLYSLKAHQKWLDLGNDRWLQAIFTNANEKAVDAVKMEPAVHALRPFAELKIRAEKSLSLHCLPKLTGKPRVCCSLQVSSVSVGTRP